MSPLYSHHLNDQWQMSYVAGTNQSAIPLGGMARYSVGMDSGNHGATRTESRTLYVEGLPSNCTKREVAHIFRPFSGFREVRLVNKESRHAGSCNLLCFVDFSSPPEARAALETLQVITSYY
ncbi:protein MATERNALLY EXPRESSED GENE 5-like [Oryza glaberrima]|uniref:protein MATERNALLY EXPRESSED GENE 5-like n=1 Tax=Oryza glaberrima TaxID=4538 RepID=UPI00224BEC05|nr:protein MATERNALLY EXPRESSED GENE 5-like [Oryza glaberrima]